MVIKRTEAAHHLPIFRHKKLLFRINQSSVLPIFCLNQLTSSKRHLIQWQQYKKLLIRLIKSTLDIVLTDHCYSQNRKVRNTTRRSHFYPVESKREAQVATLTESCSP
ncbi:unnamed protein product [Rhizophagus irregularis]|nr:unnamed protein product [Rhizophagus irregularis]CAB5321936.1 unnamed protein product [Rhizophagus irregularis]